MPSLDQLRHRREWTVAEWVFASHAALYLVINAFLLLVNLLTGFPPFWFLFPLWGWGILLAAHGGYLVAPYGLIGTSVAVFVVTMTGLTIIDLVYSSTRWFYWPLLFWGSAVVIHVGIVHTVRRKEAAEVARPAFLRSSRNSRASRVIMGVLLWVSFLTVVAAAGSGAMNGLSGRAVRGSGHATAVTRLLAPFTTITVRDQGTLFIEQGPLPAVTISGDDNIVPRIQTHVSGQTLTIETAAHSHRDIKPKIRLEYHVTVPSLAAINLSGNTAGDMQSVQSNQLVMSLKDNARLTIARLNASRLTVSLAGSAAVTIGSGAVNQTAIRAAGAARANLAGLTSQSVAVVAQDAAQVTVQVSHDLDAVATDASKISYLGLPAINRQQTQGAGRIVGPRPTTPLLVD